MKHNASQMCNERSARTQYVVLILGWVWALLTPLQNTKYRNYETDSLDTLNLNVYFRKSFLITC